MKLAVVQPITNAPPQDERNVDDALTYIETASRLGAQLIAFPESYPGPWRMPATFDPIPVMSEASARFGIHIQFGTLEPIDDESRTAHQLSVLAAPDSEPFVYRRTHPPAPWTLYSYGDEWQFEYVPGNDFPVAKTGLGMVGLEVCSEVYIPEVTRALALRGAELIFIPAGTEKPSLWKTWRNLIWARAVENLAIVVTTQNLFAPKQRGLAMVASPEDILFESMASGLFLLDIDLARVRELRAMRDGAGSTNGAKAGVLDQWQRPDLYDKILPRPLIQDPHRDEL